MTVLGLVHLTLMIAALALGAVVFLMPKGTARHKRLGRIFVVGMVVSNIMVFGIYEDSGQIGIFHALAGVSAISLIVALALIRLPGKSLRRRIAHGHTMVWAYGGVVAAGFGQAATHLGFRPWPAILICFLFVGVFAYRFRMNAEAQLKPQARP